jgi:hypothetical protein
MWHWLDTHQQAMPLATKSQSRLSRVNGAPAKTARQVSGKGLLCGTMFGAQNRLMQTTPETSVSRRPGNSGH